MQLKQNYFRRVKSLRNEIYELLISARHAYKPTDLAVKTGRPQYFKELVIAHKI